LRYNQQQQRAGLSAIRIKLEQKFKDDLKYGLRRVETGRLPAQRGELATATAVLWVRCCHGSGTATAAAA
jgi:hypothetical protein